MIQIGSYAFSDTALVDVTIPDSVIGLEEGAFSGCAALKRIKLSKAMSHVEHDTFYGCTSLIDVIVPDSVTNISEGVFNDTPWLESQPEGAVYAGNVLLTYKGTCPAEVTIRNGTVGIAESAFYQCNNITKVTIPNGVTSIGSCAFLDCENLQELVVPDSVVRIGGSAFDGTAWLEGQPEGMVYAGKVAYCYKGNCPANITVKDGTLGLADQLFHEGMEFKTVKLPDSLLVIGNNVFYGCDNLKELVIPDSVTTIGRYAFSSCGLTSVTIPDSVITIEEYAFAYTPLKEIKFGSSVEYIGYSAFSTGWSNQIDVTPITIPKSVRIIGDGAFWGMGVKEITFCGKAPFFSRYTGGGEGDGVFNDVTATLYYYPDSSWTEAVMQDYGGTITWESLSVQGDFDSDNQVTDADVIYLLWYTVFPEDYPLVGDADFDGDGEVTDADVIYLLWHTVFPEDYPLR